jgi:hypothetical protein
VAQTTVVKEALKSPEVVARPGLVLVRGEDGFETLKPLITRETKIGKAK